MEKTIKDLDIYISDGNYSSKYPRSEEFVKEGIPFIRGNNMVDGDISDDEMYYITPEKHAILLKGHVKAGDVLITTRGNIGQVAIVPERHEDSNINAQIVLLRTNSKSLYNRYLLWALQSHRANEQYIALQTGTALKQLPVGKLEKLSIKVADIDEQHDIANTLDKVYEVIKERRKELLLLDNLIKARFVEMFGIPIANTNNWPMDKAENLCTLVTDGSHFSPKACEEGYPMLSVKDMRQNGFDYSDCKLVDDETFEILKKQGCVPQADDVLIAKDGSYFTRAFAITEYKDQAILSSIGMYRPDIDKILPRFLASYLMTNEVIEFVNRGYVTGTALRRVIIKGLKNIPVYMPPMELQKEFVQFAEQVDKSKVVVKKALEQAQLLFDSLMQEYFG